MGVLHLGVVEFGLAKQVGVDRFRPHEVSPGVAVDEAEEVAQLVGQDVAGEIGAVDERTIGE